MPRISRRSIAYVASGYGSLLLCSYFDNIRGPMLPEVARELDLAFAESGWFFAVGYGAATIASYLLISTLNRYTERSVIIALCGLAIVTAAVAPSVGTYASLLVLAALVGGTVSTMGAMANILVLEGAPLSHRSRFLAGLHAMFGIGSAFASGVVGWALTRGYHWSTLYLVIVPAILAFGFVAAAAMRHEPAHAQDLLPRTVQSASLNARQIFAVILCSIYVIGETSTAIWLVTYLEKVAGLADGTATIYLTAYFLALTLARILCSLFLQEAQERLVLIAALVVPIAAFAAGHAGILWAFALVGLYGPFFPVFVSRTSRAFPDKWRAVTIWTMVAMNVLIGITQIGLGAIADGLGMRIAFMLPPLLLATALVLLVAWFATEKRTELHIS